MSWLPNIFGKTQTNPTQTPQKIEAPESSSLGKSKPSTFDSEPPSFQTGPSQPKTPKSHPFSFMFSKNQNPHTYTVKTELGSVEDYPPNKVQEKLPHHMTPMQDVSKPVHDGDTTTIPMLGTVKHLVHDDGSITNQTTPDHLLHDGMVNRSVTQENGKTVVVTHGSGTGPLPRTNNFFANSLWGGVDQGLKQDLDQSMGRKPPTTGFEPWESFI
ncbi:hypothetical protein [Acanthopleuribacter pedis]|uniref:Uncharacterized protein n=1 Tax=Acanthopleuribacter pedis TaxID=442870 RepID=A0A8J7Q5D1_9BACT|nr:hypothetical protein [Acanthopleuribacter pedis]MBO1318241.1 hypothetical protein [Acanthopleuribacter pedis]